MLEQAQIVCCEMLSVLHRQFLVNAVLQRRNELALWCLLCTYANA